MSPPLGVAGRPAAAICGKALDVDREFLEKTYKSLFECRREAL
jgi:hypothetical protein